jgi:transcriptional regulator with XRE-family HTH domain
MRTLADFARDLRTGRRTQGVVSPFGRMIRERREALGMTITQLDRRSGVDSETIRQWERHGATPRCDNLAAVAKVLGLRLVLVEDNGVE